MSTKCARCCGWITTQPAGPRRLGAHQQLPRIGIRRGLSRLHRTGCERPQSPPGDRHRVQPPHRYLQAPALVAQPSQAPHANRTSLWEHSSSETPKSHVRSCRDTIRCRYFIHMDRCQRRRTVATCQCRRLRNARLPSIYAAMAIRRKIP